MVKYKPVEFDIFPPKILSDNQVNSLYTFSKMSQRIIDETRGKYVHTLLHPNDISKHGIVLIIYIMLF